MSIKLYPFIGQESTDSAAPTGDATWTKYTDGVTTAQETVCEDAGYIKIAFGGSTYRIPTFLDS